MEFSSTDKSIELQIEELELILQIEIIVFTLEFNSLDTVYIETKVFLDIEFQKYLKKYIGYLNFCSAIYPNSLFHKHEKNYFLLYDFNDNFNKYNKNKFSYYYDNEILNSKN